ncbi:hypothetical protein Tco_0011168 [Tanacetum coccineum]
MAGKCKADDLRAGSNMREGTATRVNLEESGATCDESPKVSNSSPLVSPTATINMPRGLYNVDVAATFGVPLTTVNDLHMLIKCIEVGKHDELLCGMINDERMEIMGALEADLVDAVTIGIPSLTGDGFTKETIRVDPPIVTTYNVVTLDVEKTNDGLQIVSKKRRGKTTGISSKKYNIPTSNSYSVLNDEEEEEEEDIENVYDEGLTYLQNGWKFIFHGSCWLLCPVESFVLVAISCL